MYRHLVFSLLACAFSISAFADDSARHPVGRYVDLKGSESFEFTADHKVSIGIKGQPDYLSGTIALASNHEWAPGRTEYIYEMTFLNPRGTRGVLTCKVAFTFLRGEEVSMRSRGGGEGCPATGAHLAKAMDLFEKPVTRVARPQFGAPVVQEEMIEMPDDGEDSSSTR